MEPWRRCCACDEKIDIEHPTLERDDYGTAHHRHDIFPNLGSSSDDGSHGDVETLKIEPKHV